MFLTDFERVFMDTPDAKVIDVETTPITGKNQNLIMEQICYDGRSEVSTTASCSCGASTENWKLGSYCATCKTKVVPTCSNDLEYKWWLHIPEPIPPILHPVVYNVMVTCTNAQFMKALIDPLEDMRKHGLTYEHVGLDLLHKEFDKIFAEIVTISKQRKRISETGLVEFINTYRDILFIRHIPILDPSMHMISKSWDKSKHDATLVGIFDAIKHLSNIHRYRRKLEHGNESDANRRRIELQLFETTAMLQQDIVTYVGDVCSVKLFQKPGQFRKGNLSTRCHCTFRGVITPITDIHMADEIILPWSIMLSIYRVEIINMLINRKKYKLMDAMRLVHHSVIEHNQVIDDILVTLIKESPGGELPTLFGRNPSMIIGAIQYRGVRRFYRDPHMHAIGVSPRAVIQYNADFDGDAMNGNSIKEQNARKDWMKIHPVHTLFNGRAPKISNAICPTDQEIMAWNNYILSDEGATYGIG